MPLSIVDVYRDILPKTNCKDCGFSTCLAFASMVVSEKLPLKNCPHISSDVRIICQKELDEQYAAGKWLKKDMAQEALQWAQERAASMRIEDLPERIGGRLGAEDGAPYLELPYFDGMIRVKEDVIMKKDGSPLNLWEQVFVYNHMAQGGRSFPTGIWKGLEEIPNTVSKIKSMEEHVEVPLLARFKGDPESLRSAARAIGGKEVTGKGYQSDLAIIFRPLPRIPLLLLFWQEDRKEKFDAKVKILFDETITEHLDIESMMFLSERLSQLICEKSERAGN
jgi:hypothetical protein